MADVQHLTYGLVNPLFAIGMAALGNLLGLILATKARGQAGRSRSRLLVYAAIAVGGTGVWVPSLSALLGLSVPDSLLRYAPQPLAASLAIAVVGVGAGVAIVCTGRRTGGLRLLLGGVLIGAAIAGTNLALVLSIRVGGTVSLRDNLVAASVGAALVTAGAVVGLLAGARRLWVALSASVVLAVAVTATHYLTMAAIQVELGVEHRDIAGVSPILLFAVVILFSTTLQALLWFFSVGTATGSDLRAAFATPHREIDIEPWMIEEVTSRIAIGTSLTSEDAAPSTERPSPAQRSRPAWATAAMVFNGAALATNGRPPRTEWANTRTPVPWISNPAPVEPAATERSSTMDDTDVHGLGAALINAARISEALNQAATERGAPMFDPPVRTPSTADRTASGLPTRNRSTADRTASGLPIRGRARVEPAAELTTMDSTPSDVAVLTEAVAESGAVAESEDAPGMVDADGTTPPDGGEATPKGRRGRWRNRRR